MTRLSHEERRRQIVLGAMRAFARSGFRGTRSRDLAAAAGVSEALLFKHFPTKSALQTAIIEERIRQAGRFLSDEVREARVAKALEAVTSRILGNAERDPSFMRLLYFAGLEGEPLGPTFFRRRVSRSVDELSGLVRIWIRKGWVRRSVDARAFAWCFMGCVFQLAAIRNLFGMKRTAAAAQVVDIFLHGIQGDGR